MPCSVLHGQEDVLSRVAAQLFAAIRSIVWYAGGSLLIGVAAISLKEDCRSCGLKGFDNESLCPDAASTGGMRMTLEERLLARLRRNRQMMNPPIIRSAATTTAATRPAISTVLRPDGPAGVVDCIGVLGEVEVELAGAMDCVGMLLAVGAEPGSELELVPEESIQFRQVLPRSFSGSMLNVTLLTFVSIEPCLS